MNIYNYLFYRIYKRQNTKYSKLESALYSSAIITAPVSINLLTIKIFLQSLDVIPTITTKTIQDVLFMITLIVLNTIYFMMKKRYLGIENNFNKLSKKKNKIGLYCVILYFILTVVLFIIGVNIGR